MILFKGLCNIVVLDYRLALLRVQDQEQSFLLNDKRRDKRNRQKLFPQASPSEVGLEKSAKRGAEANFAALLVL